MRSVLPGSPRGQLNAPASKSAAQRHIALACLLEGESFLPMARPSRDVVAALRVARALGMRSHIEHKGIRLWRERNQPDPVAPCGESGLCMRLFTPLAALSDTPVTLTAEKTLAPRPMEMLKAPLEKLGARLDTVAGHAPLRVCGPLRGGRVEVDGSLSSQHISGLALALCRAPGDSTILVQNLKSAPYLELTIQLMRQAGFTIEADADLTRLDIPGNQTGDGRTFEPLGDWSSAAFMLAAGALNGRVTVRGLDHNSPQADRRIVEILRDMGARLLLCDDGVTVEAATLSAFELDLTDSPDLAPVLTALAVHAGGTSRMTGVSRLRLKESDRLAALCKAFGGLGARIETEGDDTLVVHGGGLVGGLAESFDDHRIAMALAVAALRAEDQVTIVNPDCVAKSYPSFFGDLMGLGVVIR